MPWLIITRGAERNTARSIHREYELGTLEPGRVAEVSVLRIAEEPAVLTDGFETLETDRRLAPVGCLRAGEWIAANDPAAPAAPVAA